MVDPNRTASGRKKASCSYCRTRLFKIDRTHTTVKCEHRKKALADWIEGNKDWAKKHKQAMIKSGYGIGTIVEANGAFIIVESINFDSLSRDNWYGGYFGKNLAEDENVERYWRRVQRLSYPAIDASGTVIPADGENIVSPISPNLVANQFPSDWENGTYNIPRYLANTPKKSRKKNTR